MHVGGDCRWVVFVLTVIAALSVARGYTQHIAFWNVGAENGEVDVHLVVDMLGEVS
jgi:hypothetical protein